MESNEDYLDYVFSNNYFPKEMQGSTNNISSRTSPRDLSSILKDEGKLRGFSHRPKSASNVSFRKVDNTLPSKTIPRVKTQEKKNMEWSDLAVLEKPSPYAVPLIDFQMKKKKKEKSTKQVHSMLHTTGGFDSQLMPHSDNTHTKSKSQKVPKRLMKEPKIPIEKPPKLTVVSSMQYGTPQEINYDRVKSTDTEDIHQLTFSKFRDKVNTSLDTRVKEEVLIEGLHNTTSELQLINSDTNLHVHTNIDDVEDGAGYTSAREEVQENAIRLNSLSPIDTKKGKKHNNTNNDNINDLQNTAREPHIINNSNNNTVSKIVNSDNVKNMMTVNSTEMINTATKLPHFFSQQFNSNNPRNNNNNVSNFPEYTTLRDNYIRQLDALNEHENLTKYHGVKSNISITNFINLILAIRKVSFRIVETYRMIKLYHDTHPALPLMHSYLAKMGDDVHSIDREPFIEWMGISAYHNPFFSVHNIDGSSTLIGRMGNKDNVRLKIHNEENEGGNGIVMCPELRLTDDEIAMIDELSKFVYTAYTDQMLVHNKYKVDMNELMKTNNNNKSEGESPIPKRRHRKPGITLVEFWNIWRRVFLVKGGIRRITEGREILIKRKVVLEWQKYTWQCIEFRRQLTRYESRILVVTFSGWLHYLYWCRKFNRVVKIAISNRMRRMLHRMRLFSQLFHECRKFKKKHKLMPLFITFRELKRNYVVNKLRYSVSDTFWIMSSRGYFFQRWKQYNEFAQAFQTLDIGLLVWKLKLVLFEWKEATWPKKSKFTSLSTKLRYGLKLGVVNENASSHPNSDNMSDIDDDNNEKVEVMFGQSIRNQPDGEKDGDGDISVSIKSQRSWFTFGSRS